MERFLMQKIGIEKTNYKPTLFMKVIPVSFLFIVIAEQWLKDAFYLKNILYQWTKVPMIELYVALCLLVISISLPIVYCMRQQNKDLLR